MLFFVVFCRIQPGERVSRGLLRDCKCKTLNFEGSYPALITMLPVTGRPLQCERGDRAAVLRHAGRGGHHLRAHVRGVLRAGRLLHDLGPEDRGQSEQGRGQVQQHVLHGEYYSWKLSFAIKITEKSPTALTVH